MKKILTNPFFVYIISFLIVLLVYSFGWSALYPELSLYLLLFFVATFLVTLPFGIVVDALKRIEYVDIEWSARTGLVLFAIWIGYLIEFVYNGGIPFLQVQNNEGYDYRDFGVPTFHVALVTFSSFFSVYIFHQLVSSFSWKRFLFYFLSVIPGILIINRGMVLLILTASLFVFILSLNRISLKAIVGVTASVLFVFYMFGVLGNIRQVGSNSSEYILGTSHATESFRNSVIPKEFIWSYLYISSPLANLQSTVNYGDVFNDWGAFINFELVPDFISKRTGAALALFKRDVPRIAPWLTVSTLYAKSFVFAGWPGIIAMYLYFVTTTFMYIMLLRKRGKFYVTGLALINTLVLYNTFDNMYSFSGLNFQLLYPLIFSYVKIPHFTFNLTTRLSNKI